MTSIKNHKTLMALLAVSAIAVVLTGSVHMAFATPGNSITKNIDNQGVNVQTDTDQKQVCQTAAGSSPISGSCIANSNDQITESGGILRKYEQKRPIFFY
jgi:hypothetical protein